MALVGQGQVNERLVCPMIPNLDKAIMAIGNGYPLDSTNIVGVLTTEVSVGADSYCSSTLAMSQNPCPQSETNSPNVILQTAGLFLTSVI